MPREGRERGSDGFGCHHYTAQNNGGKGEQPLQGKYELGRSVDGAPISTTPPWKTIATSWKGRRSGTNLLATSRRTSRVQLAAYLGTDKSALVWQHVQRSSNIQNDVHSFHKPSFSPLSGLPKGVVAGHPSWQVDPH